MLYSKTHEWFDKDANRIGITDYAQDALGDLTYIEILVEEGDEVSIGDEIAEIDSVKTSEVVYSPVSGIVASVNEDLEDSPQLINASAENEGWLVSFSSFDKNEDLMNSAAYETYRQEEH